MRQDRRGPIFWGSLDGPMSAEDAVAFRSEGYVEMAPESTVAVRHQVAALRRSIAAGDHVLASGEGAVWDIEGTALRSSYGVHEYVEPVKDIVRDGALSSRAAHILGSEVYVHQTQLNSKAAFFGEKFFWHQDYTYWMNLDGMPDMRALGVIVFISDVTVLNGPVMVIPGSHRYTYHKTMNGTLSPNYSSDIVDTEAWYEERGLSTPTEVRELVEEREPVPLLGKAGTVVLFDPNIVHASSDNVSPYDRQLLLIYYNSVANRLVAPTRPNIVTSRDFSPV